MVPGSFGWGSAVLAAMAMLAPSRAARSAIASPMPRLAPVMNSVLPDRLTAPSPSHRLRSVYRASPRQPRRLELDAVAIRILDIHGAAFALRPVAQRRLAHLDTARSEPGDE